MPLDGDQERHVVEIVELEVNRFIDDFLSAPHARSVGGIADNDETSVSRRELRALISKARP